MEGGNRTERVKATIMNYPFLLQGGEDIPGRIYCTYM